MGIIQKFTNAIQGSRAIDAIQAGGDIISEIKNSVQGWAGTIYNVASNGSEFIGLDYTKEPIIRDAIREYVKQVQAIADDLNDRADTSNAVKGEIEEATKKYLSAVKAAVDAYLSNLLAYSDKMHEYAEAYSKSDTTLSSDVTSEANALQGQTETYTEKY